MFFADQDRQDIINAAGRSQYVPPVVGGIEAVGRSFSDVMRTQGSLAENLNTHTVWDNEIQNFQNTTGRIVPFPNSPAPGRGEQFAVPYGMFKAEVDSWNKENPDAPYSLPTDDEMWRRVRAVHRGAAADLEIVNSAPGIAPYIGSAVGSMAAQGADPVNAVAFATFGAGTGVGLLRAAAQDAVVGAAGQAGIEALNFNYNKRINPNYSVGNAVSSAVETGLDTGGFVLGAGIAGGAAKMATRSLLSRFRGITLLSRDLKDAVNVVDKNADIEATNPFPQQGGEGYASHLQQTAEAYRAALAGEMPRSSSAAEALARETPAQTVDRQLRDRFPDQMSRLDTLEQVHENNTSRLRAIDEQLNDRETFGPVRKAFTEAETLGQKIESLQASLEKSGSDKQRAKLQDRIDAVRADMEGRIKGLDRDTVARLDQLEAERAARDSVTKDSLAQLDAQRGTVDGLRKEALGEYWKNAQADQEVISTLSTPVAEAVRKVRGEVDAGRLPPGADIARDAASAEAVVKEAYEAGVPLDQYLAGKMDADGVSSRVRAMIGLMHEDASLSKRVSDEEFGNRLKMLAEPELRVPPEKSAQPGGVPRDSTAEQRAEINAMRWEDLEKAALSPEAMEASAMDAERLIVQRGDLDMPIVNEAGDVIGTQKLSGLLAEADNELRASRELRACALGKETAE